ncbi:hypothetical protein [Candidatus Williamhamiltonella defendens]|uniref:hypothetical protein n=1 Tax=Candidatus Williamhamiltonella defendens TaxID=138072 RepID=UPI00130EFD4B|nr:hypothetical protein [Candidatus Hamiltonella defensa]
MKEAHDAVKSVITVNTRPEYVLDLIDNPGVFTVGVPLMKGPHKLSPQLIGLDGDLIRLDKTFSIDVSSERRVSSLDTTDRYHTDPLTGSKTSSSKENADIVMMTPILHLPEHEEK